MSQSSCLAMTALVVLSIATCIVIVGFATPYWLTYESGTDTTPNYYNWYRGMWSACRTTGQGERLCEGTSDDNNPEWYVAVQVLTALGVAACMGSLLLLTCWMCTYRVSLWVKVCLLGMIALAFIFCLVGVVLFRLEAKDHFKTSIQDAVGPLTITYRLDDLVYGWSFYMVMAGCILLALALCLLILVGPSYAVMQNHPYGHQRWGKPSRRWGEHHGPAPRAHMGAGWSGPPKVYYPQPPQQPQVVYSSYDPYRRQYRY